MTPPPVFLPFSIHFLSLPIHIWDFSVKRYFSPFLAPFCFLVKLSAVFIFLLTSFRQSLSYQHRACKRHLIISLQSSHSWWSLEGDDNPSRVSPFNLALVYARLLQECVFLNLLPTLILLLAPNVSFPHSPAEVPRSKPTSKSKKTTAEVHVCPHEHRRINSMLAVSTPIIPQPSRSCFCLPRDLI